MKKNTIKVIVLLVITLLLSFAFKEDGYFLQLDKKAFMKDELITGKCCINTDAMKAITNKRDRGYLVYDVGYKLNAVQIRIAPPAKYKYSWEGYVTVQNAIIVKNDTAFLSFNVPASLVKDGETQTMELKVSRSWTARGKDTILAVVKQFKILK